MSRHLAHRRRVRPIADAAAIAATLAAVTSSTAPAQIAHHDVTAWLDPDTGTLVIRDAIELEPGRAGDAPLRVLLHEDLEVTAVTQGDVAVGHRRAGGFNPKHFWRRPDYQALAHAAVTRRATRHALRRAAEAGRQRGTLFDMAHWGRGFAAAAHGAWEAHAAGVVMHMQVRSAREPW